MEEITKLIKENNLLRKEIDSLHKHWNFDSQRYQQLKVEYKSLKEEHKSLIKILEQNKIKYIN